MRHLAYIKRLNLHFLILLSVHTRAVCDGRSGSAMLSTVIVGSGCRCHIRMKSISELSESVAANPIYPFVFGSVFDKLAD